LERGDVSYAPSDTAGRVMGMTEIQEFDDVVG
jgi:hypothetical protein